MLSWPRLQGCHAHLLTLCQELFPGRGSEGLTDPGHGEGWTSGMPQTELLNFCLSKPLDYQINDSNKEAREQHRGIKEKSFILLFVPNKFSHRCNVSSHWLADGTKHLLCGTEGKICGFQDCLRCQYLTLNQVIIEKGSLVRLKHRHGVQSLAHQHGEPVTMKQFLPQTRYREREEIMFIMCLWPAFFFFTDRALLKDKEADHFCGHADMLSDITWLPQPIELADFHTCFRQSLTR